MRKHRLDPFSLVFGATFATIGALFPFARADVQDLHLKWIWPVPLIMLSLREEGSGRAGAIEQVDPSAPMAPIEEAEKPPR